MSTIHTFKHAIKKTFARNGIANRSRRRIISRFAEKLGFVYFGLVDARDDEHHVIRGMTISGTHQDDHYSVGSIDGYDVNIVERTDLIGAQETSESHRILIFEFALHSRNISNAIITPKGVTPNPFTHLVSLRSHMQQVPLGTVEAYSPEFLNRFSSYSAPTHFIEFEQYFTGEITRNIAVHFWPMAIEIDDTSLYLYSVNPAVTTHLLETMLRGGLWLAERIDSI